MDIYLEAVAHDDIIEIARYNSFVVPRMGEKISLNLSAAPTCGTEPYASTILFSVTDVRYDANNTLQTEEWITPYSRIHESIEVAVVVSPVSDDGRQYIERLWQKNQ